MKGRLNICERKHLLLGNIVEITKMRACCLFPRHMILCVTDINLDILLMQRTFQKHLRCYIALDSVIIILRRMLFLWWAETNHVNFQFPKLFLCDEYPFDYKQSKFHLIIIMSRRNSCYNNCVKWVFLIIWRPCVCVE